jgi:hypothetical protein
VRELVRSTLPWGVSLESVPIPRPAIQDPHGWRADCCLVQLSHGLGRDGCGAGGSQQEAKAAARGLWGPPCFGETASVPR